MWAGFCSDGQGRQQGGVGGLGRDLETAAHGRDAGVGKAGTGAVGGGRWKSRLAGYTRPTSVHSGTDQRDVCQGTVWREWNMCSSVCVLCMVCPPFVFWTPLLAIPPGVSPQHAPHAQIGQVFSFLVAHIASCSRGAHNNMQQQNTEANAKSLTIHVPVAEQVKSEGPGEHSVKTWRWGSGGFALLSETESYSSSAASPRSPRSPGKGPRTYSSPLTGAGASAPARPTTPLRPSLFVPDFVVPSPLSARGGQQNGRPHTPTTTLQPQPTSPAPKGIVTLVPKSKPTCRRVGDRAVL